MRRFMSVFVSLFFVLLLSSQVNAQTPIDDWNGALWPDDYCDRIAWCNPFLEPDINFDGAVNCYDRDVIVHTWMSTIYGDVNLDGVVDSFDLNILALNWGQAGGWAEGDINGDFIVDAKDLNVLGKNWLKTANDQAIDSGAGCPHPNEV